jgi:DNA-binding transcriptional LysR family regulator
MCHQRYEWTAMNIAHLRYARAVARERSFSAAARACAVTQPALSNGIAVLERMLGGRLFDRTTRGVTPTALGERLLPMIESTLHGLDAVLVEAKLAGGEQPRPLRVGVTSLINRELIGAAFETASAIVPDHDIVLRATSLAELRTGLAEAALDLLLVPSVDSAPEFQRLTVAEEPMVYLGPPGSRVTSPIELREAAQATLVLPTNACGLAPYTERMFAESDLPLSRYAGQAHDCRVLQDWVALGLGSAILPRSKVDAGTTARPVHIRQKPMTMAYDVCWAPNSMLSKEIGAIAEVLAAVAPVAAGPARLAAVG